MNHKESFLQYLQIEKRYSPHTVRSYINDLDQFYLFLSSQSLPEDAVTVTSHDIRAWIVSMLETGYSTLSIHRKISCLRVFYRFLRKEGHLKIDPLQKVVLPKRKKGLPVFVEEAAINTLLDNNSFAEGFNGISDRTIIEMLYLTGIRRSELINLRINDVDLKEATVKVTGKRNKQRIIPLIQSFLPGLTEYLKLRKETGMIEANDWFFII
jgi:integrase/recombinase XerC